MNDHALDVLEYGKVVAMLAERTSFAPSSEIARRLSPTTDVDVIRAELDRTSECRALRDAGERVPIDGARDIRAAVERCAGEGSSLSCEQLLEVASTIRAARDVLGFLRSRRETHPALWAVAEVIAPHEYLDSEIRRVIDDVSLEVRDKASAELSRIRRSAVRTRARLEDRLGGIVQKEASRGTVQEAAVHLRNGRRVLPVKSGSRGRIPGIVHDQSASGATLFVEPMETVPLNNELAELAAAERFEIERILRSLADDVRAASGDLLATVEALARIDFHRAAAALSGDLACVRPDLNEEGRVRVRSGRHPLLLAALEERGGEVIPLDLDLGGDATTLVISGPNAGGKTVTIKTVGILVLMAQSGLHVPASPGTDLGIFREVYADIGDEQSIEMSLSTFSSHLRTIGEILEAAGPESLVLIDELGAGTDPDEGASMAIAILEDLTAKHVRAIATTHLGSVKSHVHTIDGMMNGSMAFDPETLEPTFRFVPGVPGASHALTIAESLGLPRRLIERARGLRNEDAAMIDELLSDLASRERELEALLGRAEVERDRASLLARDYEKSLAGVREERKEIRREALAEAREILDRATSLVEETVREIKAREAASRTIKKARERIQERKAAVERELDDEVGGRDDGHRPAGLVEGMRVRIASLRREGTLVRLPDDRGTVSVRVRNATVEVDASDLREAREASAADAREPVVTYDKPPDEEPATELHLRGMTTDEVPDAIERFLDAATLQGLSIVRIVHGKGTGAVRQKTHDVLKRTRAVKSFRLGRWGEGDTGVTIVELKD